MVHVIVLSCIISLLIFFRCYFSKDRKRKAIKIEKDFKMVPVVSLAESDISVSSEVEMDESVLKEHSKVSKKCQKMVPESSESGHFLLFHLL